MLDGSELLITLVLLIGIGASGIVWRTARRLSSVSRLENVTVSRQWLMDHQSDD
jgi:hypothetical protein